MRIRNYFIIPFFLIITISFYSVSISHVKNYRANPPPAASRAQALDVDPTLLKLVSGPFRGMLSDYLLLKASVFIGGTDKALLEDWEAVYTLFKQSLYLDPYFMQTGYYIQGVLAIRKGMHAKAIDLLKYHAKYRDWDWEPKFYIGFDSFYYLGDNTQASDYFHEAAKLPGAPSITATLGARVAQRAGQTLTAIALLKMMHDQTQDEYEKIYYGKRLEAHMAIYSFEKAIEQFKMESNRLPESLEELVENGILPEMPENPYDQEFIYEKDSGKVFFDKVR
ncbi:MAG: hypothetical protein GY874_07110 [Desulfobacteraceae bacterium]|nr:hypothetical protein [Desulfobacteraceae bacterium]